MNWVQPNNELVSIRYPVINAYVTKNIHGYLAIGDLPNRVDYQLNPCGNFVVRAPKGWWDGFEEGLLAGECHVCGKSQEDADHQLKLVRLTNEEGLLLNEDGSKLTITHDRPNTTGTLKAIDKEKS